jgi:hypothetical protein
MEQSEKELLFLVFSAGYEAGYGGKIDLAKAFSEWYKALENMKIK